MGLFDSLKGLFGGNENGSKGTEQQQAYEEQSIDYNGFHITPAPIKTGNSYRVAATITKDDKEHHLIRADEMPSLQDCIEISLRKSKQMIDQQGEGLFESR